MKTIIILTTVLLLKFNITTAQVFYQTYSVQTATQYQADPSVFLKAYQYDPSKLTSPEIDYSQYKISEMPKSNTNNNSVSKNYSEIRVIGYYQEGYGENKTWQMMSLKIQVTTDKYGKDDVIVIGYKKTNSDTWSELSYSNPNKTYGDIAKEYAYQIFINTHLVYFSI